MGCTASKLDNEDTVRRCKERRCLMKEAVHARHHLAAAHADYCRSLRITGSAICSLAAGEHLPVSDQTPAVFIHPPSASSTNPTPPRVPPSSSPSLHPPPPPPAFSPSPSPSPTIASSKLPHILSASSVRRRRKPPKLPHILSEYSPSSSPRSQKSNFTANYEYPKAYQANSSYSSTPSQTSSVWNWENFYPPSPPDSDFFIRKAEQQKQNQFHQRRQQHHLDTDDVDDDDEGEEETEAEGSEYDFFRSRDKKQQQQQPHSRHFDSRSSVVEEAEREEVQCSEWGDHDHYSITSSSDEEEEEDRDSVSISDMGIRSNFVRAESEKQQQPPVYGNTGKSDKSDGAGSSASFRTGEISNMKIVVRHKDLKEIVEAIKENFDNAATAGDQVSEMLEIGRAQLDRSFRQLKSKYYFLFFFILNF